MAVLNFQSKTEFLCIRTLFALYTSCILFLLIQLPSLIKKKKIQIKTDVIRRAEKEQKSDIGLRKICTTNISGE